MGLPAENAAQRQIDDSGAQSNQLVEDTAARNQYRPQPELAVVSSRRSPIEDRSTASIGAAHGIINAVLTGAAGWLLIYLLYSLAGVLF